jgi:hypothetical protein
MFGDIEADNLAAVVVQYEHYHKSRKVAEGTMNISMAAMPSAWLRRKVRQVGDWECGRSTMYLATVA